MDGNEQLGGILQPGSWGWGVLGAVMALAAIFAIVHGGGAPAPAPQAVAPRALDTAAATPRFNPTAIAAMKKELLAEPQIVDLVYQDSPPLVEWQIGVHDDGSSRIGYAGYVCLKLREKNLIDRATDVRIVDIDRLRANGGDFRDASLGHIDCTTEADLGV